MNVPRASLAGRTRASAAAVSAVCLTAACLVISATALGATVIHFEPESVAALEGQLHHGQVHALSVHQAATTGHIHVSLNDGRHMTVAYASAEGAHLLAIARAGGTRVTIAKPKTKKAKASHHKLRYIAAGILVIVIIVVAAVLLLDRRRKLGEAGGDEGAEGAAGAGGAGAAGAGGEGATAPSSPDEAP